MVTMPASTLLPHDDDGVIDINAIYIFISLNEQREPCRWGMAL